MATRTRGYLPHIEHPGFTYHVVFRVADALPSREAGSVVDSDEAFEWLDAHLDAGHGKCALADPVNAGIVEKALLHFNGERYRLEAWCVMPNHVHVVVRPAPERPLARIVHSWKSFTANAINARLGVTGRFWAREWFDRFMRDDEHLALTAQYVARNPVGAGLVARPEEWRWSSAWRDPCRLEAGATGDNEGGMV